MAKTLKVILKKNPPLFINTTFKKNKSESLGCFFRVGEKTSCANSRNLTLLHSVEAENGLLQ